MLGEIYLIVLFAVGIVTYCHFKKQLCKDDDEFDHENELKIPIYK